MPRTRQQVENEIREELGLVPSFFEQLPEETLGQEWSLFKRWELEETLIPNKYKELLMLAVHAETHCRYCTLFHTEMAKMYGATEKEIQEAVHLAKHTAGWSTYLNGMREDEDRFARELEQVGEYVAEQKAA